MAGGNGPLYLYCATAGGSGGQSFGPIGMGEPGREVRTVALDGIGMVVSRAPRISFAEIPPEQTFRHLAAHQRVIEQVMKQSTAVPVKFGTYAEAEADVIKILQDNRSELGRALKRFDGKMELDVVVSWPDLRPVLQEIAVEPPAPRLKKQLAALPPDQAFREKIKLGEMVKTRLDRRRKDLAEKILAVLRDLADAVSINELKDDSMILNAALLLDRSDEQRLDAKVNELDKQFDAGLNFRCVGPLPPYSFGTAEVEEIDAERLEAARSALALPPVASFNEIKQAHRRLTQQFHPDSKAPSPDLPPEAAAARLQEVAAAFKLLEEYCQNVKHSLASGESQGLSVVRIRKLSELRAVATGPPGGRN